MFLMLTSINSTQMMPFCLRQQKCCSALGHPSCSKQLQGRAANFFQQFIVILTVVKINWNKFLINSNRFTFPPSGPVGRITRYLLTAFKLETLYEHNYNILTEPFFSSLLLSIIRCSDQIIFYITLPFSFINIQQVAPEGTYGPLMTFTVFQLTTIK